MSRFTHEDGKVSGTKTALMIASLIIAIRLMAPLFGEHAEIDLTGAAALIGAFGAVYGGRRWTQTRYQSSFTRQTYEGDENEKAAFDNIPPAAR